MIFVSKILCWTFTTQGLIGGVDVDLMCGSDPTKHSYNYLAQALQEGLVKESDVDTAASHVLASKFSKLSFLKVRFLVLPSSV